MPSVSIKEYCPWLTKAGFDPNQPRDEEGQWTSAGGGGTLYSRDNLPSKEAVKAEIDKLRAELKMNDQEREVFDRVASSWQIRVLSEEPGSLPRKPTELSKIVRDAWARWARPER